MNKIWFTSDHHFFHRNILKHENRPFDSVEEMNEYLIDKWNEHVEQNDIVYHMGDIVWGGYDRWKEVLPRLNGEIHLILGNHDKSNVAYRMRKEGYLKEVYEVGHRLKVGKHLLWLSHYPMEIGLRLRKWSICGHIHSKPTSYMNQINVGIDSKTFHYKPFGTPIHIAELEALLVWRTNKIDEQHSYEGEHINYLFEE